jgi:hypothetical protein
MLPPMAVDLLLNQEVEDFLDKHRVKDVFEKVCELVRDCYPDLVAMEFFVREDPDAVGREWLVLQIQLPRRLACTEELRDRERVFHTRLLAEVPLPHCPLFTLRLQFLSV